LSTAARPPATSLPGRTPAELQAAADAARDLAKHEPFRWTAHASDMFGRLRRCDRMPRIADLPTVAMHCLASLG
jgi:hypothetical protein